MVTLAKIPVFQLDKMIDLIEKMEDRCAGFDSPYPEILGRLSTMAFDGDKEGIQALVEEAIHD